jgi:septal ring factor EnvC (AmiA/AmiB activator)
LATAFQIPASAGKKTSESNEKLQTEIDTINLQLEYLKQKVSDSHKQTRSLEQKIRDKKDQISRLQDQVTQLSEKHNEIASQAEKIAAESEAVRHNISTILERYRSRLVQLHKIRQGTLLGSVFSAKNLNSFLNRYEMVKYLLHSDRQIIEDLRQHDLKQRRLSGELLQKQQQLEQGKTELDAKRKQLDNENAAIRAMLSTVLLEKKLLLEKEKSLAAAKNQLEKEISRVEDSRQSSGFENELAAASPVSRPPKVKTAPAGKLAANAPEAARVMNFSWPIGRNERAGVEATGDDSSAALQINISRETEILASARGKVLYKGTIGGLGNVIILGHQRGFSSVYARLDDMWVGLGQIVEQQETIGKIAAGRSRALHFEIRFGGKKQKPLDYLPDET